MKLIIGLGNPGTAYAKHRHNTGFMILDKLVQTLNAPPLSEKFDAAITKASWDQHPYILMKPMTYMNHSGQAVLKCSHYFKIPTEEIVVLYDDWALPLGKVRLRLKGGHGGHNGIRSIIDYLGTENFKRIRLGIGPPPGGRDRKHFVLSNWKKEQLVKLQQIQEEVIESLLRFIRESYFENTSMSLTPEDESVNAM